VVVGIIAGRTLGWIDDDTIAKYTTAGIRYLQDLRDERVERSQNPAKLYGIDDPEFWHAFFGVRF
jgi:hypothetical protein